MYPLAARRRIHGKRKIVVGIYPVRSVMGAGRDVQHRLRIAELRKDRIRVTAQKDLRIFELKNEIPCRIQCELDRTGTFALLRIFISCGSCRCRRGIRLVSRLRFDRIRIGASGQ